MNTIGRYVIVKLMNHIPKIKCQQCNQVFQQWDGDPRKSHWRRRFCSRKCQYSFLKKPVDGYKKCLLCSKAFPFRKTLRIRSYAGIGSIKQQFCSKKCALTFRNRSPLNRKKVSIALTGKASPLKGKKQSLESIRKRADSIRGKKHWNWKGENARYHALHYRVRNSLGEPNLCVICGTSSPIKRYEWANLTGKYYLITDYKRMCKKCHLKYDRERKT